MSTTTVSGPTTWERVRRWQPPSQYVPVLATLALFVGMFAAGGIRYEGFASPQVVLNLFFDNAFLIVLAVGMTFVILTGGIDLSVGSVVALSTMIAARTMEAGWPAELSMVVVIVVGTGLGLLMGLVIHYFDIQPFIATLAGMFLARGLCYLISIESIPIKNPTFYNLASNQISLPGGSTRHRPRSPAWCSSASPRGSCTAPGSAAPSTPSAAARAPRC